MSATKRRRIAGVAVLWGVLTSGCSLGNASVMTPADCLPGDSSMVCCIKKFPLDPMGACGATASEVEQVLNAVRTVEQAAQLVKDVASEEDDPDKGWKQHCIDNFVHCRSQKKPRWVGDCYACFRNCEGQRQWPFDACYPKKR